MAEGDGIMAKWALDEVQFLLEHYPVKGREWSAKQLGRSSASIRSKAARLGLRQDRDSAFFKDWQARAAQSKVGKKRPEQALVMLKNHADGKLKKTAAQRAAISKRMKAWIAKNGHVKGATGMKHTEEAKKNIGKASIESHKNRTPEQEAERVMKQLKTREKNGTLYPPRNGSWKQGWREIGGIRKYYRSRWEANYARYL